MTISNAQSQTLKRAAMYVPSLISPHGQFCVSFSGSSSFDKVALQLLKGVDRLWKMTD